MKPNACEGNFFIPNVYLTKKTIRIVIFDKTQNTFVVV